MNAMINRMRQPRIEVIEIPPAMAEEMLKSNTSNRNLRPRDVQAYANEITMGRWKLNGESIKFDWNGNLLDGQHRLHAVVLAGKPITIYVVWDLPPETFPTIDQGIKRTASDILGLAGVANSSSSASIARILVNAEKLKGQLSVTMFSGRVTSAECLAYVRAHPEVAEAAKYLTGRKGACSKVLVPQSVSGACYCLFGRINQSQRDEFFDSLYSGANLVEKSPVLLLRNRLMSDADDSKYSMRQHEKMALWIKSWNAFRAGKTMHSLRWRTGGDNPESFPQPI